MEWSLTFSLPKLRFLVLSLVVGHGGPGNVIGLLALNRIYLRQICQRFLKVKRHITHNHVNEFDELIEIVAEGGQSQPYFPSSYCRALMNASR